MPDLSLEFAKQMAKDRLATGIHRSSERMNNPNEEDATKNKMAKEADVRSCFRKSLWGNDRFIATRYTTS